MQEILEQSIIYARTFISQGKVATYIPMLAQADPTLLGVCIKTVDGHQYGAGDYKQPFTIQSISKTILLILALQVAGYDQVFSKVGFEPSGDAFNSIVKLETKTPHPLNPMINAGAIAVASCLTGENRFEQFLKLTRRLCGRGDIQLNEGVYSSEKGAGMRNRSMAYFMQSERLLDGDIESLLDFYFKMCSIDVTAEDLANYGMIMANGGVDPKTGERLVENWILRIVKTLMVTCGLYDGSGEFAIKVGIPSKSGVGGGIVSAVENRMGLGVFSPALDTKGNSIGGYRVLEYLSFQLGLHYFARTVKN